MPVTTPLTDQQLQDAVVSVLRNTARTGCAEYREQHPQEFSQHSISGEDGHSYDMTCALCTRDVDALTASLLAVVKSELDQHRAEVERLRGSLDDAHCRLHHIGAYVKQITEEDDPVAISLDLTPWFDGPLHPDHITAWRTATTAQFA